VLAAYESPAATAFPEQFRATDHTWTAFAARARVFLVNTDKVPESKDWPQSVLDMADVKWKGRFTMAKPFFGSTASHAACLYAMLGDQEAGELFRKIKDNDVVIMPGNKQVAVAVGQGRYDFCLTDTDDAMAEVEAGKPVAIVFPDQGGKLDARLRPLYVPNTAAMIQGGPNPDGARKLVDYLLGPEVEAKLARSASKQIPLNPHVKVELPREIMRPNAKDFGLIDFRKAAERWDRTQKEMVAIFSGP
jgi:iron(III) transport system substrate-binding protein